MKKVVIIGGGLGGLVAGAKLAREGYEVILLEKHYIVGGCATIFKRKSVRMEVSLHQLDGLDELDLKSDIFREFDTFNDVDFVSIDEFYSVKCEEVIYKIPTDAARAIELMTILSPEDGSGIKSYFEIVTHIRRVMNQYMKLKAGFLQTENEFDIADMTDIMKTYQLMTVGEFLDGLIESRLVKKLLVGNFFFYTDDVYTLDLVYFAVAQGSYIEGGAHYIKGGSQSLSNHFSKTIKQNNGCIIAQAEVTKILVSGGDATGVRYFDIKNKQTVDVDADVVIANACVPHVVKDLLERQPSSEVEFNKYINRKASCSLSTLYMVVSPPLKDLGNDLYSQTLGIEPEALTLGDLSGRAKMIDVNSRLISIVDYSQIDSGLARADNKSLVSITMVDYLRDWEGLSEEEYCDRKENTVSVLMDRLDVAVPGASNAVLHYEMATPKTILKFTNNHHGSPYGFERSITSSRLRSKSSVKNLFYASAWMSYGGGFTGAITSGYMCATEILRDYSRA